MNTDFSFVAPRNPHRTRQLTVPAVQPVGQRLLRLGLGLAFALVLAACASTGQELADAKAKAEVQTLRLAAQERQSQRENELQSAWKGQPYNALVERYGAPKMFMNVLGRRALKTSLVVYGMVDQTANCVDAFTMEKVEPTGQWTVADYFCR